MSSPRYTGYVSPPYTAQLLDDGGAPINLTGVNATTDFTLIMQNASNLQFQHGAGVWTITDVVHGEVAYQWTPGDLAVPGTFLVYVTVLLPGEPSPRAFDPDIIPVVLLEMGGVALSGQAVNLIEVNGQPISPTNPVPVSDATQGTTADAAWSGSGSGTQIAILKKLVSELAGTLAITATDGAIASLGTEADAAWSGSGSGTAIAILKKIEAVLAVGGAVTANAGTNLNTSALALESGGNLAAAKADLDSIVTNTNKIPASPATEGGHLATIDTSTAASKTDLDAINTATGAKGDAAVTNPALSASQIALLKGLITILAGTLTISGSVNIGNLPATQAVSSADGSIASLGAIGDAAWSGSGNGSAIAILKKIEAVIAGTLTVGGSVSVSNFPGTQSVSGTITANAGTNLNTSLLALESGGNLASIKADLDTVVTNTNKIPASPATEGGHLATIDTSTAAVSTATGATNDAAVVGDNTGTLSAKLRGLSKILSDIWDSANHRVGTTNPSIGTDGSAIPASSTLIGASDGTNLQQLLVESASNRNLRTGLYNGANEAAVDSAGNQQVKGGFSEQSGLSAGSLNADLVASVDVSAYKWLSLHINTNAYVGTLTFQGSNDNVNWVSAALVQSDDNSAPTTTATTTNIILSGPVTFRFFRVRMTAYTSGTAQGTIELYTLAAITTLLFARQAGTWTVQPGNTANSTPWLVNASQIGGQAPKLDNTNELGVSLYGKSTTAGDTAIKVNSTGDQYVLGDFTEMASLSAGSLNADLVASTDVSAYKWLSLHINASAYVGTLTFQGSNDNSGWISIDLSQSNGSAYPATTSSTNIIYNGPVYFRYLRIRMTAYTSGTAQGTLELYTNATMTNFIGIGANGSGVGASQSGTWTVQPGNTANTTPWLESIHDGTNKANVMPATSVSNAIGSQGALLTGGAFAEQASLTAGSLNADLVASTDVSNYKSLSLHINTSAFVGTLTFQASNDNANWSSVLASRASDGVMSATTTVANNVWVIPNMVMRYFRVRMTSYTSGTAQATLELYTSPTSTPSLQAIQNGTWTVQPGNTVNTSPWLVTGSNNNAVQAANTAGNVVIKGSAGLLQGAMITATGTVGLTVYDNASTNSGTPVLVIPANPVVGTLYPVNGWCKNGITSAGVANCPGVTFFFA